MTNKLMVRGQALSTYNFSGSAGTQQLFEDGGRTYRIQGFKFIAPIFASTPASSTCTIKDNQNTILFSGGNTQSIWPSTASGSYGLTCFGPLTYEISATPSGSGGVLVIYGEVL